MARFRIDSEFILQILYASSSGQRFTQDTQVLPEVWTRLAENPEQQTPCLLVPMRGKQAHHLADELHARVKKFEKLKSIRNKNRHGRAISDMPGLVSAKLHFDEIVNIILPLTSWWSRSGLQAFFKYKSEKQLCKIIAQKVSLLKETADGSMGKRHDLSQSVEIGRTSNDNADNKNTIVIPDNAIRLLILIGIIGFKALEEATDEGNDRALIPFHSYDQIDPEEVATGLTKTLHIGFLKLSDQPVSTYYQQLETEVFSTRHYFLVSLDRKARMSSTDAIKTIKADAAERVFEVSTDKINWAIIDSGIDARHPAFRKMNVTQKADFLAQARESAFGNGAFDEPAEEGDTRIKEKYDMTLVQDLRNRDILARDSAADLMLIQKLRANGRDVGTQDVTSQSGREHRLRTDQNAYLWLKGDLRQGRPLNWDLARILLRVSHDKKPDLDHGTHVAGILGGCWIEKEKGVKEYQSGVCPDINIYDFNVVGNVAEITEYAVVAAQRLIRHINESSGKTLIQGANISLSIPHDVTNYACGRTPVCEEAEDLAGSGVVVVAAAGNHGYNKFHTDGGLRAFHTATSITDPGNAQSVITVGSTHRRQPHTYGVSYFSSRGPTGDGRLKPDLVAPGEKIYAPICDGEFETLEGTSMAAPYVSGVAAMMLARFSEFIGDPAQVKQILCNSATDLGREPNYQGHGLVDALRALQSI